MLAKVHSDDIAMELDGVYVRPDSAAEIAGIGYRALMLAITRGALPALRIHERSHLVLVRDVEHYRDSPRRKPKRKKAKLARRYNGRY